MNGKEEEEEDMLSVSFTRHEKGEDKYCKVNDDGIG
jgi:hypothetical protein